MLLINQWRKPIRPKEAGLYTEYKFYCITTGDGTNTNPYKGIQIILFPKDETWELHTNVEFRSVDLIFGDDVPIAYHEEIMGMCKIIEKDRTNKSALSGVALIKENYDKNLQPSCWETPLIEYYDLGIAYQPVAAYISKEKASHSHRADISNDDTQPL